jgi:ribosomal protein L5
MRYEYNRRKYIRGQGLMNICMAKAYRTTSGALCIVTGMTPNIIKSEEAVKQYNVRKGNVSHSQKIDQEVGLKIWTHEADVVNVTEEIGYKEHRSRYTQTE